MRSMHCQTARRASGFAIAGLALLTLSGCATMGACVGGEPIYVAEEDVLTDGTAKQILANNESGAKLSCPGFTPKKGR